MAPPHHAEKIQKEGRITLAVSAIQKNQISSGNKAAKIYNVPQSTLNDRQNGRLPRLESRSKFRLLLDFEEETLISWIYNMERRGFPSHIINIRRIAQTLLTCRGASSPPSTIGKNWIYRWIKRHPEVDARLARSLDSQRAKNEDPKIIAEWF